MLQYLLTQRLHGVPLEPWEYVFNEKRVQIDLDLFQLCFPRVQWECCSGGFAHFARAGEEVEREKLHLCEYLSLLLIPIHKRNG